MSWANLAGLANWQDCVPVAGSFGMCRECECGNFGTECWFCGSTNRKHASSASVNGHRWEPKRDSAFLAGERIELEEATGQESLFEAGWLPTRDQVAA